MLSEIGQRLPNGDGIEPIEVDGWHLRQGQVHLGELSEAVWK